MPSRRKGQARSPIRVIEALEQRARLSTRAQLVRDINTFDDDSNPTAMVTVNGVAYFAASEPSGGLELWKSDGTAAGTVRVKDIYPGPIGSTPANLINVNGTLFFTAEDD